MPWNFGGVGGGAGVNVSPDGVTPSVGVGVGVGRAWVHQDGDRRNSTDQPDTGDEEMSETTADKQPTDSTSSSPSRRRESRDDRIKRLRNKARTRKGGAGEQPRDKYLQQQDQMHGAVSKAANVVHLFVGTILSFLKTFFQRSMLSVVAIVVLLGGMALAAEAYCVSSGALPGALIPKPGVGLDMARANIEQVIQSYGFWDWFWVGLQSGVAITVQVLQWASVKFLQTRVTTNKAGTTLALKGFGLIIFALFAGALWWQDLAVVSSLYLVGGFSLGGLLIWFWAAFPSEIAESIFSLQRSLPEEG